MFSDTGQDWDERVSRIQVPVLIVMGSRDPDFKDPKREAYQLAERIQRAPATVRMIDGAGHHPHTEMPDHVVKSVLEFLKVTSVPDKISQTKFTVPYESMKETACD